MHAVDIQFAEKTRCWKAELRSVQSKSNIRINYLIQFIVYLSYLGACISI